MTEWKMQEFIILTFLLFQVLVGVVGFRKCVGCKEKVSIKWEKVEPNIVLKMKINKKSKKIELQKSPLVLDPYDPRDRDTCIFEGYWNANKKETPITVLGCPNDQEIEVSNIFIRSDPRNWCKFSYLIWP